MGHPPEQGVVQKDMDGYPSDWSKRRKSVLKRDDYTCQNCGDRGGPYGDTELHADHVVPKSKGGTHDRTNLLTLCKPCHEKKHGHRIPTGQGESQTPQERPKAHNDEHLSDPDFETMSWFFGGILDLVSIWSFFTAIVSAFMVIFGVAVVLTAGYPEVGWDDVIAWVGLMLFTATLTYIFYYLGRYDAGGGEDDDTVA